MKYTIEDIPYLVGLHFRISSDAKRDWAYLIHSYRFDTYHDDFAVYVDWPDRNDRHTPLAMYSAHRFIDNLNNER